MRQKSKAILRLGVNTMLTYSRIGLLILSAILIISSIIEIRKTDEIRTSRREAIKQFEARSKDTEAMGLVPCRVCGRPADQITYKWRKGRRTGRVKHWYCPDHARENPTGIPAFDPGKSVTMHLISVLIMTLMPITSIVLSLFNKWNKHKIAWWLILFSAIVFGFHFDL